MKISLFLNDYFVNYTKNPLVSQQQLDRNIIQELYNENDLFILRGEPTLRPDFKQILDIFKNKKNYILTTHLEDSSKIFNYDRTIPYISINWDGINNDIIRGGKPFTSNMIKLFNVLKSKKTIQRISYTMSQYNLAFIDVDARAIKRFMTIYPKIKQPYFNIYQKGYFYNNEKFTWPPISKEHLTLLNQEGLLTKKNFEYLLSWITKQNYQCTSIENEITIMPDATVRLCQSHRIIESLGSLKEKSLHNILKENEENIKKAKMCPLREQCWLSH
ncbi:MAG: hypothetical protein ACOC3V_05755, partial [bacterium]